MYYLAAFQTEKTDSGIFMTNDAGNYVFLPESIFEELVSIKLEADNPLYSSLKSSGFIYEDMSSYAAEFSDKINCMKSCLFTGTRLFILVLTDICNQRCVYCQAGDAHTAKMNIETCKKAIDIAVQIPVNEVNIEFQGGEPTANPETLKFAIQYAKKAFENKGKKVDFSIVTNLTNPDPQLLEMLITEGVSFSTSLDGHQLLHDINRPLTSRLSSYDAWRNGLSLYKKICESLGKPISIGAIQTTTKQSLQFPEEIIEAYLANGLNQLYLRPLTPLGHAAVHWDKIGYTAEEYLDFYFNAVNIMISMCISGRFVKENTAALYLERILNKCSVNHTEFRSPCGAAVGQMAVNYDGKIYTCDEGRMIANMGDEIFKLGTVENSYRELITSPVAHAVCTASCVESLPFCSDCAYSPYCAVCPAINYGIEGDLISHVKDSYKCVISKGIIRFLINKLESNNEEEKRVLESWIGK